MKLVKLGMKRRNYKMKQAARLLIYGKRLNKLREKIRKYLIHQEDEER